MIDLPLLAAFVTAIVVLTITPGVDTAMVLRASALQGRRAAVMASLGICAGCLIWGSTAALGLGVLLRASQFAYTVVRFAGAAYLLYLGGRLLLAHCGNRVSPAAADASRPVDAAFRQGFLTNILNPKVGMFYVTFFPQFVPADANVISYSFLLAFLHIVVTLVWFAVLIAATAQVGAALRRPATVRLLDRLTGGIFVAFGIKLALTTAR